MSPIGSPIDALAILAAGVAAGVLNTIVGSGSLITFPTLLAIGYAPVVANISNTVGLVAGSASGVVGYRRELSGQGARIRTLGVAAVLGGATGACLLLVLPASTFARVVPILIAIASVLMALQPRLSRLLAARRPQGLHGSAAAVAIFLTAIYGGYFGAAQSVLFMAFLAILIPGDLQRLNALKNVLALLVNLVAAVIFIAVAHVAWEAAGLIALGSIVGAQIGAAIGRRLPAQVLRSAVVIIGLGVAAKLLFAS